MQRIGLTLALGFLLACPSGDRPPATTPPAPERQATEGEIAKGFWVWPVDGAPRRSALRDSITCKDVGRFERELQGAHPLTQLKWHFECMERLGWVRKDSL